MMLSIAGREHGGLHELLAPIVPEPIELVEIGKFSCESPVREPFEPPALECLSGRMADDPRTEVHANELIADAPGASIPAKLIEAHGCVSQKCKCAASCPNKHTRAGRRVLASGYPNCQMPLKRAYFGGWLNYFCRFGDFLFPPGLPSQLAC